jgi:hypothetical protein
MRRPRIWLPDEDYLRSWVHAVGDTTIPVLAGFSVTSVIVVSDDAANFRWPGLAILALGFASVVLIASVQSAYHARMHLLSEAGISQADVGKAETSQADKAKPWAISMLISYYCGIVALLAGLGLVLVPLHETGMEGVLRWFASTIAFGGCAVEAAIIFKRVQGWRPSRVETRKPLDSGGLTRH